MAQPTKAMIHLDQPLSDIAMAYKNEDYIADKIFPPIPVPKQSDKYFIWTKDFWFRSQVELRTPGDTYPEAGLELSSDSYFCDIYHLAFPINDEDRANQDPAVQLEQTAAEWLADQFLLKREILLATTIFTTGVWTSNVTLSGTTQWSDYDNSTPIASIDTGMQAIRKLTGKKPNVLVMGEEVKDKLKMHPDLLELYKYTGHSVLTDDEIRQALGVDILLIGSAIQNTAVEKATFAGAYIWGKNALLLYVKPGGLRVATAGLTFVWNAISDAENITTPITNVREDNRDRNLIRGKQAFDFKVAGADCGYFINTAIA